MATARHEASALRRRWSRPPRLRADSGDRRGQATLWTELFFDLIFVAALGRTSALLVQDPSATGFAWSLAVLVLVVWTWMDFVAYADRFEVDDVVHRLLKACAMVGVGALAVTAPRVRAGGEDAFALAYVAVRAVLVLFYLRAWRHVPDARPGTAVHLTGLCVGTALWAASVPAPDRLRPWLWVAGGLVDLGTPLLGWRAFGRAAAVAEHLQNRYGRFVLIALGAVVTRAVEAVSSVSWGPAVALASAATALLVVSLWWLTFDFFEISPPEGLRGLAYVYGHLVAYCALAVLSAGVALAIRAAEAPAVSGAARAAVCGSVAAYLCGVAVFQWAAGVRWDRAMSARVVVAAAIGAVGLLGSGLSAPVLLLVVALLGVAQLVAEAMLSAASRTPRP